MYECKIKSVWVGTTEYFDVTIKYLGKTFNFELFPSMVDASQFSSEWWIENVNETDTPCPDDAV